jgi:hypothetical protein
MDLSHLYAHTSVSDIGFMQTRWAVWSSHRLRSWCNYSVFARLVITDRDEKTNTCFVGQSISGDRKRTQSQNWNVLPSYRLISRLHLGKNDRACLIYASQSVWLTIWVDAQMWSLRISVADIDVLLILPFILIRILQLDKEGRVWHQIQTFVASTFH